MKLNTILNRIIKTISEKTNIPEKDVISIIDEHIRHIKFAIAEKNPVEVKLDYFGKFIPKPQYVKKVKEDDKSSEVGEWITSFQPRSENNKGI